MLIGSGAPTHIFLPDVAKALGMRCVIPENFEVANAVGAVVADISAQAAVSLLSGENDEGDTYYTIAAPGLRQEFETYEEALEAARNAAGEMAANEARRRGALGELNISVGVSEHRGADRNGNSIDLGTEIIAQATGRMGI